MTTHGQLKQCQGTSQYIVFVYYFCLRFAIFYLTYWTSRQSKGVCANVYKILTIYFWKCIGLLYNVLHRRCLSICFLFLLQSKPFLINRQFNHCLFIKQAMQVYSMLHNSKIYRISKFNCNICDKCKVKIFLRIEQKAKCSYYVLPLKFRFYHDGPDTDTKSYEYQFLLIKSTHLHYVC